MENTKKQSAVRKSLIDYAKAAGGPAFATIILIFAVFSIFWGSLWKVGAKNLHGWVVDFDGGLIGQNVVQALSSNTIPGKITWTVLPASQFASVQQVADEVFDEKIWVAITINPGATARLQASVASPNASYDGSEAITVYGVEARSENAYRSLIRPSSEGALQAISEKMALQLNKQLATNPNVSSILATSPQTITQPVYYRINNLVPFDQPVASAVIFVGLIYQVILAFFIVNISFQARMTSGVERILPVGQLILLRMVSMFVAYFFLSLFYSLLSLAFKLDVSRKFGHAGFLVFWMLNYVGMLALGMALDSLLTLLTMKGIPFFMLFWIILNVSVCAYPIEALPRIFHYGYAAPFYNISNAMRSVIFGTKNVVGFSFGILLVWVAISCISLPLIQIYVARRDAQAAQAVRAETEEDAEVAQVDQSRAEKIEAGKPTV